jgi:hypothetical protein
MHRAFQLSGFEVGMGVMSKLSGIFGHSSKSGSLSKSGLDADKQQAFCWFDFDTDFDFDPDKWLNLAIGTWEAGIKRPQRWEERYGRMGWVGEKEKVRLKRGGFTFQVFF